MANNRLATQYEGYVANGRIRDDSAQRAVVTRLEKLYDALLPPPAAKPSLFGKLLNKPVQNSSAKGVYLWGGVGRGKSMLMDLFYNNIDIPAKRRVHFHAFMQEVHASIHELRKYGARDKSGADPVIRLARKIAADSKLLCFDELQATDVADATLLYRLFSELFDAGTIIVSTSNQPPATLYTGGVQRERFNQFIALIESHMEVISLASPNDYRHQHQKSLRLTYYSPLGSAADAFITESLRQICRNTTPSQASLSVHGRKIPFLLYDETVGRFSFLALCAGALGPADYLAIARKVDWLILTDIPRLTAEQRNEAKRFVTLVDALYEHRVKLIATAEVPPKDLYASGDGSFEFQRTVSRLVEMQSESWISQ